jgi:hypothetical protein
MIRAEVYEKVSDRFGVSIGVANILNVSPIKDIKSDIPKNLYNQYTDDLKINLIISEAIDTLKYKDLQRALYKVKTVMGNRKIKELTIYNRAWDIVTNGNNKTKSESGEILKAEQ